MSVKLALNTFTGGMMCDVNEYVPKTNTLLTTALNATINSSTGDEYVLLNDLGNQKINENVKLADGFFPVGIAVLDGIMYIASVNNEGVCEIGTYPSPDYNKIGEKNESDLIQKYSPLNNAFRNMGTYKLDKNASVSYIKENGKISLCPFTTKLFKWDINHPVLIDIQKSYDGSVNLILNDNKNIPRLLNTRLSITASGKFKIPDRMRNNDNIYHIEEGDVTQLDQIQFDTDTALIKRVNKFPVIDYEGQTANGNLKVGNYVFYFKYCDDDKNATDFVAESGLVSVFKGNDGDPFTVNGGIEDENAYKTISFKIDNFDESYQYIKVYYVRYSSLANEDSVGQTFEIVDPIYVDDSYVINITGNEDIKLIDNSDIQRQYSSVLSVKSQALEQNTLFLANVTELDIYYKDLTDISLRIKPYCKAILSKEKIGHISQADYNDNSGIHEDNISHIFKNEYYNTKNIYYNVGYWNEEYYRLGIVYIYQDNTLSPVFNILGGELNLCTEGRGNNKITLSTLNIDISKYPINDDNGRTYIPVYNTDYVKDQSDINIRGVVHINDQFSDYTNNNYIYALGITIPTEVQKYLKGTLNIQGFFIVRQKRLKTILALGFTLPWDKEAHIPIIQFWAKNVPYFKTADEYNRYLDTDIDKDQSKDYLDADWKTLTKWYYQSDKDTHLYWFPHYCVEGFIAQQYTEVRGVKDNETTLYIQNVDMARELTNNYRRRLFYINPSSIDDRMFDYDGTKNGKDFNVKYRLTAKKTNTQSYLDNFESCLYSMITNYPIDDGYTELYKTIDIVISINGKTICDQAVFTEDNLTSALSDATKNGILPEPDKDGWRGDHLYNLISLNYTVKELYIYGQSDIYTSQQYFKDGILVGDKPVNQDLTIGISVTSNNGSHKFVGYTKVIDKDKFKNIESIDYTRITGGYAFDSSKFYYTSQALDPLDFTPTIYSAGDKILSKVKVNIFGSDMYIPLCNQYYSNHLTTRGGKNAEGPNTFSNEPYKLKHWYDRYKYCDGNQFTAICPEFEVNQVYYNQFFTGSEFYTRYTSYQLGMLIRSSSNERLYYPVFNYKEDGKTVNNALKGSSYSYGSEPGLLRYKIVSVTEEAPTVAIDNTIFTGIAGTEQEAFRFSYINEQHSPKRNFNANNISDITQDFNMVRGIYAPYLGIVSQTSQTEKERGYCRTFNIYSREINGKDTSNIYLTRFIDYSPYYAISNRLSFLDMSKDVTLDLFRGDCFLCTFTHRLNRNFQDSSSPTNDSILDPNGWNNHYPKSEFDKINKGDVNAIKLGSWITVKVRSSLNLSIRSTDQSHISERAVMGRERGFYPLLLASADGGYKIPDSYVFNGGFKINLGSKRYIKYKDSPYIKNEFCNRILYSSTNVNDSYINGYRVFDSSNYQDYTKQYGEITKIMGISGNLLCVMEHGLGLIPLKERVLAGYGDGGDVYVNNNRLLPETMKVINDHYGSQWPESVIQTASYIYGIDASARKIWKSDGSLLAIISDDIIERFLYDNIPFKENEHNVDIRNMNIKTFYNKAKSDVMFVLYYHTGDKTVMWNICYNETSKHFVTFYSWIPAYIVNIDGSMYSFGIDNQYIWKHGIVDAEYPKPTNWYGKLHPFEFEFIVNDYNYILKIFQNLLIVANNAEPESFHFTISGDCYGFSQDLKNIYYRQEATKDLFHSLDSSVSYDENYRDIQPKCNKVSTIFPLYYRRDRHTDLAYDKYKEMMGTNHDYNNLSGTEVTYDRCTDRYNITTHIKNTPIDQKGRIRGNSHYKEDRWFIQIPSITFEQKNEDWKDKPPIVLPNIPNSYDNTRYDITEEDLPNTYGKSDLDVESKWSYRQETKLRDKYIKIKIRYSGEDLAVILNIITQYQISVS